MKMKDSDAAYLAGLFDGEGSVYYKKMKQIKHKLYIKFDCLEKTIITPKEKPKIST